MSKFVIAGRSNCPRFAKMELLADQLEISLPHFRIHKIVLTPAEWTRWLTSLCERNGWTHDRAKPLAWRELLDRGGKGFYVGGFNEFLEYAQGYYGIEFPLSSVDSCAIARENLVTKEEILEEEREALAKIQPLVVAITNSTSLIAYHFIPRLLRGDVFGEENEIRLKLLDSEENLDLLTALQMEIMDSAFPLFRGVFIFTDAKEAFTDAKFIISLDEVGVDPVSRRSTYLQAHADLFKEYAAVLTEIYGLPEEEEEEEKKEEEEEKKEEEEGEPVATEKEGGTGEGGSTGGKASGAGGSAADEGGAGESVAGKSGAGESVAGKSGAGESVAGKSGAGESVAGGSGTGESIGGDQTSGVVGDGDQSQTGKGDGQSDGQGDGQPASEEKGEEEAAIIEEEEEEEKGPRVTLLLAGPGPVTIQAQVLVNTAKKLTTVCRVFAFAGFEETLVKSFLSKKMRVRTEDVADVAIWGINHLNVHVDVSLARAHNHASSLYGPPWWSDDVLAKVYERAWLEEHTMFAREFMTGHLCRTNLAIQSANVIHKEKASSTLKKQQEIEFERIGSNRDKATTRSPFLLYVDSLCVFFDNFLRGSDPTRFYSCGVASDGSYGVPPGLFFSFPCSFLTPGQVEILSHLRPRADVRDAVARMVDQMTRACQKVGVIPIIQSEESKERLRLAELDWLSRGWRRIDDTWSLTSLKDAELLSPLATAVGLRSRTASKIWGPETEAGVGM